MKRFFLLLSLCLPLVVLAQKTVDPKYMAGAVPEVNGKVIFQKDYELRGKTKAEIFTALSNYAQSILKGENQLPQCKILKSDEENGLIAVNMEEWLYFRRSVLVTHRTRFFYQLLFQIKDGGYNIMLRNIHYLYEEDRNINGGIQYTAEDWITDKYAIVKNGTKLSRLSGKFRTFTIDRKDQLFQDAYYAAGGKKKIKKVIEVEVDE